MRAVMYTLLFQSAARVDLKQVVWLCLTSIQQNNKHRNGQFKGVCEFSLFMAVKNLCSSERTKCASCLVQGDNDLRHFLYWNPGSLPIVTVGLALILQCESSRYGPSCTVAGTTTNG